MTAVRAGGIALCAALGAVACAPASALPELVRTAAALAGAYALARRLGLATSGAAIAAASFAGSGALLGGVGNASAACLPWILLGVELCRGERRAPGVALAAGALIVAVCCGGGAAAALVGLASFAWALGMCARDARAGRAALLALAAGACAGAPAAWAWARSGALAGATLAEPDWLALGLEVLALALAVRFAGRGERAFEPVRAVAAACGMLLLAALLARRIAAGGAQSAVRVLFFPDVLGGPGHGPWRGAGDWLDAASAWVPFAALALALAALLSPARAGVARLPSRGVALALALIGLALALRLPGVADAFARDSAVGAGAASVGALFFALFAGEAFAASTRTARAAAAVLLAGLAGLALLEPADARAPGAADPSDELVAFTERPPAEIEGGALPLAGWIAPGLDYAAAVVVAQRLAPDGAPRGRVRGLAVELAAAPSPAAGERAAPEGARGFRVAGLRASDLEPGTWRFTLELRASDGRAIGARVAGIAHLVRRPRPSRLSLFFAAAGLLALLVLPRGAGGAALVLVLVVGQALDVRRAAAEPRTPPPESAAR